MSKPYYNILLIDDSEDDYLYLRTLLEGAEQVNFNLTWIKTIAEGIAVLGQNDPTELHLYLLNFYLEGEEKGLDLLKIGVHNNAHIPCIFLIDSSSTLIDSKALALGASDVLCKDNLLTSRLLERSILHALERSRFNLELKEMAERLTLAKTSANLGVWEYNVFEDILTWDDRTCELYDIRPEEFNGKRESWESYIYPDDLAEVKQNFQTCLDRQMTLHAEFRILLKQSKIRYIEIHAVVIGQPKQRSHRMIGINLDISDRKKTEAKLQYMNYTLEQRIIERTESLKSLNLLLQRQSESVYHANQLLNIVMNSIPQGIFWKNRDSVFLGGNQRFANDFKILLNELQGKSTNDLQLTSEEIDFYTQHDREVMDTGQSRIHCLETLTKPDGSIVYMDTTKVPLRDQMGKIMGVLGCYEDVSDRKRVEFERQKLLQELSAFRSAIDRSASIAITDANGIILEANDRFCALSGYDRSELIGQTHALLKSHYHPPEFYTEMWKTITQGDVWQGEICNRSKVGQLYWEESSIAPLLGSSGEPIRYLSIRYDISSRKAAEQMIQKQAEQEKLLREISQRINQSLELQSIFEIACNDIRLLLQCDRVCIFKFDSVSQPQSGVFIAESIDKDLQSILNLNINMNDIIKEEFNIFELKDSIVFDHIYDYTDEHNSLKYLNNFFKQFGIRSCLIFPLRYSDRLWGFLCIYHGCYRAWQTSEIDFTQQLSHQLTIAVQQTSLVEQLQQELQDRQAIQQQLAERNEQLGIYNEELLRATRLKDEFLASMSHELRTPLNAILGMAEILQEDCLGTVTPEQRDALQTIQRSGAHLLELINDLLDVSKIASGQLDLHLTPVSISQLCQASLDLIQYQALQKNIRIQQSIPNELLQPILDERRIRQVLVNLLNNAVKFTGENGNVSLIVTLTENPPASAHPYHIDFIVEDTGIGIAPKHLSRLFQPFVQIDSALNRQYAGTGLGLALVKGLLDLHQGNVSVSSTVGVGSRFTVTIPCQVANPEQALTPSSLHWSTPSPAPTPQPLENYSPVPQILLAEDNPANVSTLKLYLEAQGYGVCLASNGAEAIVMAQTQRPQLILMDIQMPIVDGLKAIEILRRDPDFDQTPIIALTALAMPGDRAQCLAAGATDYLSKPVQLKALKDCIKKYVFGNI